MTNVRPLNLTHVARIDTATGSTIEPPFNETWTDTQKIAWHAAVVTDETGLPIAVHAVGRDYAITVGHIAHSQRSFRDAWTLLNGVSTGALAAQRAREDGHTPATDATEATGGPEPADEPNGPHAGADGLHHTHAQTGVPTPGCTCGHDGMGLAWHATNCTWRTTDEWTRALEQRNTRLRKEHDALRRAHRALAHHAARLERELRQARHTLADARDYLAHIPNHHINTQARADLRRRLNPADDPAPVAQQSELPTVIHRTPDQLRAQRAQLIAETGLDEETLRERAADYQLPVEHQLIWNTVEGIDYLLDQPDRP